MKLIKPNFEILEQENGLDGVYKQIEKVGRTCYKSEDKIAEGTAKPFVDRMIASKHYAMIEHGTIYLNIPVKLGNQATVEKYFYNAYSRVEEDKERHLFCVTTNLRVLVENDWTEDLGYLCNPTEFHVKRVTVKFTCDRGVSHEFVRHRVFSFAQESTRYCNYSKDKFSNEIIYICPCWLDYNRVQELTEIANRDNKEVYKMGHDESLSMEERGLCSFIYDMSNHEHGYLFQISAGWTPQQARAVLPNSLKTELVMTGFVDDWNHFFDLRARGTTGAPHPQAKELAEPLLTEFIKRGLVSL